MSILALKLILAPLIIGGASLAGRRWGPAVSGWLIGLPLTSGPVAFFVAISHGTPFLASTILGTLSGGFSLVAFCLGYAWLSIRFKWPVALAGSMLAFAGFTLWMQNLILPLGPVFTLVILVILAGMKWMPRDIKLAADETRPGQWDLPARIFLGTGFILLLTWIAPLIGPRLTGLLSTIPLYTAILTVFAHRQQGSAAAASVLRGLLLGLFAFAGFYLVLALLLEPAGIATAFVAAILTTLAVQGLTFFALRNSRRVTERNKI
jgi:hypothetical protein